MSKPLYSNKIHSLYTSLKSGQDIDPNQIRYYKSQIKNIKEFHSKEKQKIEKKLIEADDKIRPKNQSEKNTKYNINNNHNNNDFTLISNSKKKFSNEKQNNNFNNNYSRSRKKQSGEEDFEIYDYNFKNLNPNIKKDIEKITLKLKERFDFDKNKDEKANINNNHNINNNNISNFSKGKKNIFKLPMTADINLNKKKSFIFNKKNSYINNKNKNRNDDLIINKRAKNVNFYLEDNSFKSFNFKDKINSNSSANLTSNLFRHKLNLNNIKYNSVSSLAAIQPPKSERIRENKIADMMINLNNYYDKNKIKNDNYNNNECNINDNNDEFANNNKENEFDSYSNLNKQINNLYLGNSRNFRTNNKQNKVMLQDLSNVEKTSKQSFFDFTKSSDLNLNNKTANFKNENTFSSSVQSLSGIVDQSLRGNSTLINKNGIENNGSEINNKLIQKIIKNKTNKIQINSNKETLNKLDYQSNEENESETPTLESNNDKSLIKNPGLINKESKINKINEVNEDDYSACASSKNKENKKNKLELEVEKQIRNKNRKISILKNGSNQTHKSASTSAPSIAEINAASIINNNKKAVIYDDDPYGISNLGNSAGNSSSANSTLKEQKKPPKEEKYIKPFKISNNSQNQNNNNKDNSNNTIIKDSNGRSIKPKSTSFKEKFSNINNLINSIDSSSKSAKNVFDPEQNPQAAADSNKTAKNNMLLSSASTDSFFHDRDESPVTVINEEIEGEENKTTRNTNQKSKKNLISISNTNNNNNNHNNNLNSKSNIKSPAGHFRSTNKNLPIVNKDEINCEVYIAKINRENQRKHIPVFKNQFNLNNHLIRDFQIGMVSDAKSNSKKKYTMTEKLHLFNEKKRRSIREEYIKSIYGSGNIENEKARAKTSELMKCNKNRQIQEYELEHFEKTNNFLLELQDLDKKNKEKIIKKSKDIADKIVELNNEDSYESFHNSFDGDVNKVSKKNIEKVIKLKKILKSNYLDDMDLIANRNANKVRQIKEETQDLLTLTLHKLGPPAFLKTKFKNQTVKKYQIVSGKYFGC